jgi:DNA ligase-1
LGRELIYSTLADTYEKLEAITKRLEMTDILADLFRKTNLDAIGMVVYLTQGKIHPDWMGKPEIGMAEKMASKAVSRVIDVAEKDFIESVKKMGDIGFAAEKFLREKTHTILTPLTIHKVYETLDEIAEESGPGSSERKIARLGELISNATSREARYILRTVTGRLRLGVGDMTVIDALAVAYAACEEERSAFKDWVDVSSKEMKISSLEREELKKKVDAIKGKRAILERSYNISSDLGYIAKTLAEKGLDGLEAIKVTVGKPVRMMLAQRLGTAEEIIEKLEGRISAEWKMDGERFQMHKRGDDVEIFSRRLENITSMYPDAVEMIRRNSNAEDSIVEGECVAIFPDTEELQPFQTLMQRRRKYRIREMMEEVPIAIYLFDCLYVDGRDLTLLPYPDRRNILLKIVKENTRFKVIPAKETNDAEELRELFDEAVMEGCEGLIMKSTRPDSIYRAGARSWLWVKWKRSYQSKMVEPIDLVVVGAFMGRGRRAGTYGALLAAAYDEGTDAFKTVCKVGSGYTDEVLGELPKKFKLEIISHRHPRVETILEPDVWIRPTIVMEVIGDEVTLSPIHTCGFNYIKEGAGLAVRFPRFTGRWRPDKSPEDATTVAEITQMYEQQLKKVA